MSSHTPNEAYTHYAFFEWALIILDILYDSILKIDLDHANLQVRKIFLLTNHIINLAPFLAYCGLSWR